MTDVEENLCIAKMNLDIRLGLMGLEFVWGNSWCSDRAMRQKWNGDRAQSGSRLWKEKGKEASGAVYGKWSEDGSP